MNRNKIKYQIFKFPQQQPTSANIKFPLKTLKIWKDIKN